MSTKRYEIKFVLNERGLAHLLSGINVLTTAKIRYPCREINSVYYDDAHYSSAVTNLAGLPDRKKMRVRWYVDREGYVSHPSLEFKIKQGRLGKKIKYPIQSLSQNKEIMALTYKDLSEEVIETIGKHQINISWWPNPTMHIVYLRHYYEGMYGIRLTIDRLVRFYSVNPLKLIKSDSCIKSRQIIAELKFSPTEKDKVSRFLTRLRLVPRRHSKYLDGLSRFGIVTYQ